MQTEEVKGRTLVDRVRIEALCADKDQCDGANPCGRCRTDNAICVFGERKKAHDKVYPKG